MLEEVQKSLNSTKNGRPKVVLINDMRNETSNNNNSVEMNSSVGNEESVIRILQPAVVEVMEENSYKAQMLSILQSKKSSPLRTVSNKLYVK